MNLRYLTLVDCWHSNNVFFHNSASWWAGTAVLIFLTYTYKNWLQMTYFAFVIRDKGMLHDIRVTKVWAPSVSLHLAHRCFQLHAYFIFPVQSWGVFQIAYFVLNTKHFESVTVQSAFTELLEEMPWSVHPLKTVQWLKPHAFSVKMEINRNKIWLLQILTSLWRQFLLHWKKVWMSFIEHRQFVWLPQPTYQCTSFIFLPLTVCMQKCGEPYRETIMHFDFCKPGPKLTVLLHGLHEKIAKPLTISFVDFL